MDPRRYRIFPQWSFSLNDAILPNAEYNVCMLCVHTKSMIALSFQTPFAFNRFVATKAATVEKNFVRGVMPFLTHDVM
jgi:hypothetical protein